VPFERKHVCHLADPPFPEFSYKKDGATQLRVTP